VRNAKTATTTLERQTMKTKVIRVAVTELDENEAMDLSIAIDCLTSTGKTAQMPTAQEMATAKMFSAQLQQSLG
jgi:hypothetical protein